jgi:hypothetical protein
MIECSTVNHEHMQTKAVQTADEPPTPGVERRR